MPRAILAAFLALVLVSCGTGSSSPTPEPPPPTLTGVSLSPRSFTEEDFQEFLEKARELGTVITWSGDWAELAREDAAPAILSDLSKRYDFVPVYIATVFNAERGPIRPLDEEGITAYEDAAVNFAAKHQPPYLGLGIEVNILADRWPDQFERFVKLFHDTARRVREVSPETQIFTVFQLEQIKGLKGGAFGGTNDPAQARWDLLDRFSDADFFAFTTYPGLVFSKVDKLPSDYYAEISAHTRKPIAFTEVGWPWSPVAGGAESDEASQAEFARRFFDLTRGLSPTLLIWAFLYDQPVAEPFIALGLIRADGSPRPAYEAWREGISR